MADTGRPPIYDPSYVAQARELCERGATDAELAEFFGVHRSTIYRWKHDHSDFCDALKLGKHFADERVKRSLYAKAVGYTFDAVKIFMPAGAESPVYAPYVEHVPPSDTAAIFWLKNRDPENWRDKQEVALSGKLDVTNIELTGPGEGPSTDPA